MNNLHSPSKLGTRGSLRLGLLPTLAVGCIAALSLPGCGGDFADDGSEGLTPEPSTKSTALEIRGVDNQVLELPAPAMHALVQNLQEQGNLDTLSRLGRSYDLESGTLLRPRAKPIATNVEGAITPLAYQTDFDDSLRYECKSESNNPCSFWDSLLGCASNPAFGCSGGPFANGRYAGGPGLNIRYIRLFTGANPDPDGPTPAVWYRFKDIDGVFSPWTNQRRAGPTNRNRDLVGLQMALDDHSWNIQYGVKAPEFPEDPWNGKWKWAFGGGQMAGDAGFPFEEFVIYVYRFVDSGVVL